MTNPLKEWRGERTQDEAASLLGVSAMTYSRWERGVHLPRKSQRSIIREKTGVAPEQLLELVENGGIQ